MTRLRHLLRLAPSAKEVRLLPDTEVTFAPMDALADGLGGLDTSQTKPFHELASGSYNYFRDGDLLLAKVTPCFENGKKALAEGLAGGMGFATSEVHVLRPEVGRIDPRFLLYLLSSEHFRAEGMRSMTGAGGLRRVGEGAILDHRVEVTDLPIQKRIATFLDRETARIDALIEKKQRLIIIASERLEALLDSAITHAGPITRLGHHVDVLSGYAFPSDGFSHDPADVRLLRGVNVSPGSIRWDDVVYWPTDRAGALSRFELREGDLVLGMDRPWISSGIRVARISADDLPALLLQRVCRISPRPSLTSEFLEMLLRSRRFLAHFEPILTGVSVPHISPDQIGKFRFSYVPREKQALAAQQFNAERRRIERMSSVAQTSIDRLREYRAALITAAVTGQIDVDRFHRKGGTDRTLERIEEEMGQ